jgi:FkbM family methyltransferase
MVNLIKPANVKQVKIDIGLSYSAPNSSLWVNTLPDRWVIGIEPNPENIASLQNYPVIKNKNFTLIEAALDNVAFPQLKKFYLTETDPGCSSLYKPTLLPYKTKKIIQVNCLNFNDIINEVRKNNTFSFIEHVKIDTQGNDFNILKSLSEDNLKFIVFLNVECTTFDHYEKSFYNDEELIDNLLSRNGFKCIDKTKATTQTWNGKIDTVVVDKKYVNTLWEQEAKKLNSEVV